VKKNTSHRRGTLLRKGKMTKQGVESMHKHFLYDLPVHMTYIIEHYYCYHDALSPTARLLGIAVWDHLHPDEYFDNSGYSL